MSPETFSTFRLEHVLDAVALARDEPSRFSLSWYNGHWDEDEASGAKLYYPKRSPAQAAILQVWCSREAPEPFSAWMVGPVTRDATLVASGNRVLSAIDAPMRFGDPLSRLQAWAGRQTMEMEPARMDPRRSVAEFSAGPFDIVAVMHEADGLLAIEIRRSDLVVANDLGE